jgi:hypothetical protein
VNYFAWALRGGAETKPSHSISVRTGADYPTPTFLYRTGTFAARETFGFRSPRFTRSETPDDRWPAPMNYAIASRPGNGSPGFMIPLAASLTVPSHSHSSDPALATSRNSRSPVPSSPPPRTLLPGCHTHSKTPDTPAYFSEIP